MLDIQYDHIYSDSFYFAMVRVQVLKRRKKIPKPEGSVPVFGHLWAFLREKNHLKLFQDWSEKHGPIFRFNVGLGKWNTSLRKISHN